MPSVCIVIAQLSGGGAERVAANLAADLAAAGWKVTVITLGPTTSDDYRLPANVARIALARLSTSSTTAAGLIANVTRVIALRKAIRRIRPEAVLAMMTTTAILAILATRGMSCRVVVSERVYPPLSVNGRIWSLLRVATYRFADLCVAQTEAGAHWLRAHCGAERTAVIHNAVVPLTSCHPALSTEVSLVPGEGSRVLLAVGRLERQKGFDTLIEAFAAIAAVFPNWLVCVLGEGPERDALQHLIKARGLESRVYLVGRVRAMYDWYERCDAFCLSSRFEGFPNALLEAMSAGRAVVSFDCPTGPNEIITNRVDGLLVDPSRGVEGLTVALTELMGNEDLRRLLGQCATRVRERFSRASIVRLWQRALLPAEKA